jgi:hypothetical protein
MKDYVWIEQRESFYKLLFFALSSISLSSLNFGCGPSLKEVNKGVENIEFECSAILPIPKSGCYTGTNKQWNTAATEDFPEKYGIPAAFNAPGGGTFWVANDNFPTEECAWLFENNIIPLIRYVVFPHQGYRPIIQGKSDDDFKAFANKAAAYGKPVVLAPWQAVNEPRRHFKIWAWSQADPSEYKSAWVRMYEIFKKEGANANVLWTTKLINWGWTNQLLSSDSFQYIPPREYIDIVGWLCCSNIYYNGGRTFEGMINSDYKEACLRYPSKPQFLWELGADNRGYQSGWMDTALFQIKTEYPQIKGIMFDEHTSHDFQPDHTDLTIKVIRKHFTSNYFLGSALKNI